MASSFLKTAIVATIAAGIGCNAAALDKREIALGGGSNWHKYVRSPATSIVKPKAILAANTTGDVANPNGLLDSHGSPTVLTRKGSDDKVPSVVVDFGQNVVGIVYINFAGSTNSSEGFPGLKLAFSETQQFLTNTSDFTRSDNMPEVCDDFYEGSTALYNLYSTNTGPGSKAYKWHRSGKLFPSKPNQVHILIPF